MFKIKCYCGVNEKSFKHNIGERYFDECCARAGLNEVKLIEASKSEETPEVETPLEPINKNPEVKTQETLGAKNPLEVKVFDVDSMEYEDLKDFAVGLGLDVSKQEKKDTYKAAIKKWYKETVLAKDA